MSDQPLSFEGFEGGVTPAGEQQQSQEGEQKQEQPEEMSFSGVAGGVTNESHQAMLEDPAFFNIIDIQQKLPDAVGSDAAQLREDLNSSARQLAEKYDVSLDEVASLAESQRPTFDSIEPGTNTASEDFVAALKGIGSLAGSAVMGALNIAELMSADQQVRFRRMLAEQRGAREWADAMRAYQAGERKEMPTLNEFDVEVENIDWKGMASSSPADNWIHYSQVLIESGWDPDKEIDVTPALTALSRTPGQILFPSESAPPLRRRTINAVRTVGFLGDIFNDRLLAGAAISGLGRVARWFGASKKATDDLIRAGRQVEEAASGVGAVKAAKAVTPKWAEGVEKQFAAWVTNMLNSPAPFSRMLGQGREISFGETLTPRGRGFGGAVDATDQPPDAVRRGAGRPEELVVSERTAQATVDDAMEAINTRMHVFRDVIGPQRFNNWGGNFAMAASRRVKAFQRADALPTSVRDQVQMLAGETSDNMGIMLLPESLDNLSDVHLSRNPLGEERNIFGGESVVEETLAEELRPFASMEDAGTGVAERAQQIYALNRERVRRAAADAGVDPERALNAYDSIVRNTTEADAIAGYYMSGYEPIKEKFFENVAAAGGNAEDAGYLWRQAYRLAGEGEDMGNLAETYSRRVADPTSEAFGQLPTELSDRQGVSRQAASVDEVVRQYLNGNRPAVFDPRVRQVIRKNDDALRTILGHTLAQAGDQQLNLGSMFNAWTSGHLRQAYSTHSSPAVYQRWVNNLNSGRAFTNRIVDSTMYSSRLEGKVRPEVQDLIQNYVEVVSPSNPVERGFMIRGENLVDHLIENGVSPMEAAKALQHIRRAANEMPVEPGSSLSESAAAAQTARSARASSEQAQQRAATTGRSVSEEREARMTLAPESREARHRNIMFTEEVTPEQALRRLGEIEGMELEAIDVETLGAMGRIWDPELLTRQTQEAMAIRYPKARFLQDVERFGRKQGVIARSMEEASEGMEAVRGAQYGPLDGAWLHPWLAKEVRNALANPGGSNLLSAANRVRSTITAGLLTLPKTLGKNHVGGLLTTMLDGGNPFTHMKNVVRFYRKINKRGGLRNMPYFDEMGDLFSTGMAQDDLAQSLQTKYFTGADLTTRQGLENFFTERLPRVITDINRMNWAPGLRSIMGLEAFTMSENAHKWARYVSAIEDGFSKKEAYRMAARNVFDYGSLPGLFRIANNTGVVPFIGFPYFMTARLVGSAIRRPGTAGATARLDQAAWNAVVPNEDIQHAITAEMEEYQEHQGMIPMGEQEPGVYPMFPLNAYVVTDTTSSNPFFGSLFQGGIWQGALDYGMAQMMQGRAPLGEKYGQRVFQASVEGPEGTRDHGRKFRQQAAFLANNYMPAWTRVFYQPGMGGEQAEGLVPEMIQVLRPAPQDGFNEVLEEAANARTVEMDNWWMKQATQYGFGSPTVVSIRPESSRVMQGRSGAQYQMEDRIASWRRERADLFENPDLPLTAQQRIDRAIEITEQIYAVEQSTDEERRLRVLRGWEARQDQMVDEMSFNNVE